MLTREDDIDVHALHRQGWTISAIARHLGKDRKTVRAYLNGRQAGVRQTHRRDHFEPFAAYVEAAPEGRPAPVGLDVVRRAAGPGVRPLVPVHDEGDPGPGLRPACEACRPTKGRAVAVIEHPPGQETQWDWVELPDPPEHWGWGKTAYLLVGALSHSGRWRGVLCESMEQPHLIDALDRVARALGGLTKDWRFDRMATVVSPGTGQGQRLVRGRREALRRDGQAVPAAAGEPQGRRGEGQPCCRATVLADRAGRRHRRGGAGAARHVVRHPRRRADARHR
jgi:hypothetical protein